MTSPSLFRAAPVQSYYNTQQLSQSLRPPRAASRQSPCTHYMLTAQIIMCHTSVSKPIDLGNKALIELPHCP